MLWKVVGKELRELSRDQRLCRSVAVVPVLLVGVLAIGGYESRRLGNVQRQSQHAARENWLNQGQRDPHGAAHHGIFLFKPKPPLAFFDPGLDPYLGTTVRIEAHHQHRLANRPAADATDSLRFDASTTALMLQVVLPLVVILLGFSAVSGERERGTLPLVLSLGIPNRTLVLGKSIAILAVVGLIIAPLAPIFGWVLTTTEDGGSPSDIVIRAGLLAFGYAAYLGGWIGFTLAVSARAKSSKVALILLIAVWATSTLLVPRLANESASRLHPLPTQEELEQKSNRAARFNAKGENPVRAMVNELEAKYLAKYQVKRKQDLPINFEGVMMQASEEFTDKLHDEANASLEAIFGRQDQVVGSCAWASPFLAIRMASMSLTGTDRPHHERFSRAAETYRRGLIRAMNEALARQKPAGPTEEGGQAGRDLWESVDTFRYRMPDWTWAARNSAPGLILLQAWFVLSAGLALTAKPRIQNDE
ncbi:ABC-2 type transport system permease protein [Singulisphaera sp. GP187]|uniref:DUF3526 domain-containing protein n=1 Tax=Singulisphaera sp. GP187 TaxID=1882752 RepID=UPI000927707A|nr:DUF3526 domain-containing protein [Singulisphaera sp. GP187]SIO23106.1 ABC-2 type transport system permease protein [Singulisphaera sp. GP187]